MCRPAAAVAPVEVQVTEPDTADVVHCAQDRIRTVVLHAHVAVLHARVRITHHADPAVERPVTAQATSTSTAESFGLASARGATGKRSTSCMTASGTGGRTTRLAASGTGKTVTATARPRTRRAVSTTSGATAKRLSASRPTSPAVNTQPCGSCLVRAVGVSVTG